MLHKGTRQLWVVRVLSLMMIFTIIGTAYNLPMLNWNTDSPSVSAASYQVKENNEVAPGVTHRQEQMKSGYIEETTNIMEVDVSKSYNTVQMNYPVPFPSLSPVTTQAESISKEGNRVLGSINGSFFHTNNALPAYLVSEDQSIFNLGAISSDSNGYMSIPTAFGMDENGRAQIGEFYFDMEFEHDGDRVNVDSVNKDREAGEIIVYTPSYRFDWTKSNQYGIEITVANLDKPLDSPEVDFGEQVTGNVTKIRPYGKEGRTQVPDDGFVLSIQGGALSSRYSDIEVGDDLSLSIDIPSAWKDTQYMLGSGPMLVQNGQVDISMNEDSYRASERHPRTAVGTSKDGSKVYFVTVDGRQNGYSDGMNLTEFAEYLESKGIYQAMNLDGGGSTTMAVRQRGDTLPSVVNSPSDGWQRSVSTTLHAVNTATDSQPTHLEARKVQEGKIMAGSSVEVEVGSLFDQYNYPISINESNVRYSVNGNVGHMEGNRFVADREGSGAIVVTYGTATKELPVDVVEDADRFTITPSEVKLGTDTSQAFHADAYLDNEELIFDKNTIEWSTEGSIGTIDQDGNLTADSDAAKGSVVATLNGNEYKASVAVGGKAQTLDEFTSNDAWSFDTVRAKGANRLSKGFEPLVSGDSSMRFEYDFVTGQTGTAASYIVQKDPISIDGRPDHIGMWVYGDDHDHWLRGKLIDGNGKTVTISFTEQGELDWSGWKYVTAEIPDTAALPLSVSRIYIAEINEDNKNRGVIFLDRLRASYDDSEDTEVDEPVDYEYVRDDKEWRVEFNTALLDSSVSEDTVYVVDHNGKKVDGVEVRLNSDHTKVYVEAPGEGYEGVGFYKLVITDEVTSSKRVHMKEAVDKIFQVE